MLTLAIAALASANAHADGYFQIRGFLPAPGVLTAFTVDAAYRVTLGADSLDFKVSGLSLDRQSAALTYTTGRLVVLGQFDRSATLAGHSGLLLGVIQASFEDPLLQTLGLTVTNATGSGTGYAYATTSADVNASGRFSDALAWTLSGGGSLTTTGVTDTTDLRARAELKAQVTPDVRVGGGASVTHARTAGPAVPATTTTRVTTFADASVTLTPTEKLNLSGSIDQAGSYALDASVDSSRFEPWTFTARTGLSRDNLSYALSASRTPDPLGVRVTYGGSSGATGTHNIDVEGQYQEGSFGAQLGGGLTATSGLAVTSSRLSAGLSTTSENLTTQIRANASLGAFPAGSLSARVTLNADPARFDLGASLNLSSGNLTGEVDAQLLYKLTDTIDLNASARYRPGTLNAVQGGFGLRVRF